MTRKLHFPTALLPSGWHDDVLITVSDSGDITTVETGAAAAGAERFAGAAVPGVPNVHSHAHQRAMVGLAERAGPGTDSFWTWRETMYGFVATMTPDDLEAIAAQLYVEMLKAGFTAVGEFQYLHHQPDGQPYATRAEMSLRCLRAADAAGIGITILPTLYAYGGFGGAAPAERQKRFLNQSDGFLEIVETLIQACAGDPGKSVGISPHSLRAVTPELLIQVVEAVDEDTPVHIHVAEQVREVEECIAWSGKRPVDWLLDMLRPDRRWSLIHATHMTDEETLRLAQSPAVAGLCPTTEANLGDGIFPARDFLAAGGRIAIGSDSQIAVSPAEDLRTLEYAQRLVRLERNVLAGGAGQSTGRRLLEAALSGGAQALAQPVGAIREGARADIVVLDTDNPLLAGRTGDAILDTWIFAGTRPLVGDVIVGGRHLVQQGRHVDEDAVLARFQAAIGRLMEGTS